MPSCADQPPSTFSQTGPGASSPLADGRCSSRRVRDNPGRDVPASASTLEAIRPRGRTAPRKGPRHAGARGPWSIGTLAGQTGNAEASTPSSTTRRNAGVQAASYDHAAECGGAIPASTRSSPSISSRAPAADRANRDRPRKSGVRTATEHFIQLAPGNGRFRFGSTLDLPRVTRRTDMGLRRYRCKPAACTGMKNERTG